MFFHRRDAETQRSLWWIAFLIAIPVSAQNQVQWSLTTEPGLARLTGKIEPGWHVYSMTTPAAIPTTIKVQSVDSYRVFQPQPKRAFDPNFGKDSETFEGEVTFLLEVKNSKAGPITVDVRYQTCDDKTCIPPVTRSVTADLVPGSGSAPVIPAGYTEVKGVLAPTTQSEGIGTFLLVAFGLGLASIFTPCVFPMIPITMSFFLNRTSGSRAESLVQAAIFCIGIVVLFSGLGLAATALLGPFGVVQLGSNPWVNGVISLVFLAFALSLLGAFEITLPSSLLTKLNAASERGGILGTLLMGLTFSLASFACVGPFVGTLLAASVQGGGFRPFAGMLVFATGLALPFFLLALFPSYLKKLPRSGGWMSRVKVVMAFIILAAMLYKLSAVDQVLQWNVITRERFLALWAVIFAMPGLYLLGWLPLEGVKSGEKVGLGRLFLGMGFLALALSLLPGMTGAKLGELDAYVPVAGGGSGGGESGLAWLKNQYREALDRARREGKLVFVNFTGYACTNCHWMKANMFPRPEIAAALKDFVLVELYTDGTDAESQVNQKLQLEQMKTIAIPYYAIIDPDGKIVATFPGLTKDPAEFLSFLQKGKVAPAAAPASTGPKLQNLDGSPYDAASWNGKTVVLNYWATWCVPCIQEIPGFNKLYEEYKAKGVVFVGASADDDPASVVPGFLKSHPIKYPVARTTETFEALPVTLVIGKDGKTVQKFNGFTAEADLKAAIEKAL